MQGSPNLDLILIGRNEARHLPATLQAAQAAAARLHAALGWQTLTWYVDSDSSDGSPDIAAAHGARVLLAHPGYHSAANGRASGLVLTQSEFVMLLDADCTLHPDWLAEACAYLLAHPAVGGVGGLADSMRRVGEQTVRVQDRRVPPPEGSTVNNHVGYGGHGFLYRRAALDEAGGYEPGLIAQEEALLYCRLRRRGWGVLKLPLPMMTHWDDDLESGSRGWQKFRGLVQKNAFYQGIALRRALFEERVGVAIFGFYRLQLAHAAWLLLAGGLIVLSLAQGWATPPLLAAAALSALYLAFLYHQKQSTLLALVSLPLLTIYVAGITWSLLTGRPRVAWGAHHQPEYTTRLKEINSPNRKG
ncbi:MAG: glycosyltransferase [Anaerolineae bacterium]|nr:MAG: glycosyltransferase [Anaerolineae bacterium]